MFKTIIKDNSSLCLYGNEGGDYKETNIELIMQFEEDNCKGKCSICDNIKKCRFFYEKATIHHSFEDIHNGEEIFNDFIQTLEQAKRGDNK